MPDALADETLDTVIVQFNLFAPDHDGITLPQLAHDLSASRFHNKEGGTLSGIDSGLRIRASLKTEGGIGGKLLSLGRTTDGHRIEVGAFDEDVDGALAHSGLLASEHPGYAHGPIGICYDHVAGRELALHSVEGPERFPLGRATDNHFPATDLGRIESMQGLTCLEEDEVADIHDIVYGPEAY